MPKTELVLLARALQLRDAVAAGRFDGEDSRFAASMLGAWLEIAREQLEYERLRREGEVPPLELFEGEPPNEEMVNRIELVYREIEHRLSAH